MPSNGLIRESAEIKLLLLYILRRMPAPIDSDMLFELCRCDLGFGYFEYVQCLHELIENKNIIENDDGDIFISRGSIPGIDTLQSTLPYTVRKKAEEIIAPAVELIKRNENIIAECSSARDGCYTARLALSDGQDTILDMSLLCSDKDQAKRIKKNFRKNAENFYLRLIEELSEEKK